jgi:hypothetical protein
MQPGSRYHKPTRDRSPRPAARGASSLRHVARTFVEDGLGSPSTTSEEAPLAVRATTCHDAPLYQRCADGGGVGDQGKPVDAMLQGQRKLRSSEPCARLDGEREVPKRPNSLNWKSPNGPGPIRADGGSHRGKACSAKTASAAGDDRRNRGGGGALGLRRARSYRTSSAHWRFALQVSRAVIDGTTHQHRPRARTRAKPSGM